jgi:starvation-inducible DNA-binding protein
VPGRTESELKALLADVFGLYFKTKSFHWHMSGRLFRDYHLMLDEHAGELFAITDDIAERARKIGATTLRSIGDVSKHQRIRDNNSELAQPREMLMQLLADNRELTGYLRLAHELCGRHKDIATTSMIEVWTDQAERRSWFLAEIVLGMGSGPNK